MLTTTTTTTTTEGKVAGRKVMIFIGRLVWTGIFVGVAVLHLAITLPCWWLGKRN